MNYRKGYIINCSNCGNEVEIKRKVNKCEKCNARIKILGWKE